MLERLFVFIAISRVLLAVTAGAEAQLNGVERCTSVADFLTGCGSTVLSVMSSLVLGTIPGPTSHALAIANLLLITIVNGLVAISLIKLARGVPS